MSEKPLKSEYVLVLLPATEKVNRISLVGGQNKTFEVVVLGFEKLSFMAFNRLNN